MSLLRLLVVIALVAGGVHWWHGCSETKELHALMSPSGFLPVPMPQGSSPNTVLVFAPLNCPREGAQRARALTQRLKELGISTVETNHYGAQIFEPSPEAEAGFKRLNIVMMGEIPIVLINGMGKANPSIEEVVSEFKRTQ